MLVVDGLEAGYGQVRVLSDVSLTVDAGEVISVLGANGAGKTTLVRTISGLVRRTRGSIVFDGAEIGALPPHKIARSGIVHVPEGRELFGSLTVRENLEMGAYGSGRAERSAARREVEELFPVLAERPNQRADSMSGGQQQMLAIARGLMGRPKLLILDEPSLGLAPKLVAEVLGAVERIRASGITVMLVEQNAAQAVELSDRFYLLEGGSIVLSGQDILDNAELRRAYLGM